MKYAIALWLLVSAVISRGGTPETIFPKTKIIRSTSWYAEQSSNWKNETIRNRNNPSTWYNYFAASRYALRPGLEIDQIVREMEEAVPGTFELQLVKAWQGGFSQKSLDLLKQAFSQRPGDPLSYGALIMLSEFSQDRSAREDFCNRLFQSGMVSESLLNYNYNVLMSLDKSAILFTEGENATIPLFLLQDVLKIREDVTILNLDMLAEDPYRIGKLGQLGLSTSHPLNADPKKELCTKLPVENPDRQFYYALTLSHENIDPIKDQLYVVGLASRLSRERLDNISVIKENLEKNFLLDYLTVDFNGENEWAAGRALNPNYLVPMLMLNDYYTKNGSLEKSRKLEQIVIKLAKEGGRVELINNFLNRESPPNAPFVLFPLKIKELEETFKVIRGNLYVQKTEVTNEQYNAFLKSLHDSHQEELLKKYSFDISRYTEPAISFMKMYHSPMLPFVKQESYFQYPAINLSFESAKAYCEWLTEQYNGNPKRKMKKVKFRLPSVKEWQIAALGYPQFQSWDLDENTVVVQTPEDTLREIGKGKKMTVSVRDEVLYPWWGAHNYRKKAQNMRNCWLGNFKIPEGCKPCLARKRGEDGFEMMGQVGSYFANGMGLYDVVGNVAEMTEENGKACGGSWNHFPEESTIRSINSYSGPDSAVGFRVFMEVIEP